MADRTPGQAILEDACQLATPADNVAFFRTFAPTYDTDFADDLGWHSPKAVAAIYTRQATASDLPVADVGCGTGAVATEPGPSAPQIDGIDISPEMLAIARGKNLYRTLHALDLTGPLDAVANHYCAVLSAGTFAHGHLGPGPLPALLGIARAGGLFVIGINQVHFETQGFAAMLTTLAGAGRIGAVKIEQIRIYSKAGHAHSDDCAFVVQFRKL